MKLCCKRVVLRLEPQHDRLEVCDPTSETLVLVEEAGIASDIPKESLGHREISSAHLVDGPELGHARVIARPRCCFQSDTEWSFGQLSRADDMANCERHVRWGPAPANRRPAQRWGRCGRRWHLGQE